MSIHRERPRRRAERQRHTGGYGAPPRGTGGADDWLDEDAAELLVTGAKPAPPDGRATMTASRLARLLADAADPAGLPGPDPARESAALAAFRKAASAASAGSRKAVRVRGRALRMSAAAVGAVLAVGSVAVAVAGARGAVPGEGAGSGPVSRPPAAVSSGTSVAGAYGTGSPASVPPAPPTAATGTPTVKASPGRGGYRDAHRDRSRAECRTTGAQRPHCGKRHEKGHSKARERHRAGDTSVG